MVRKLFFFLIAVCVVSCTNRESFMDLCDQCKNDVACLKKKVSLKSKGEQEKLFAEYKSELKRLNKERVATVLYYRFECTGETYDKCMLGYMDLIILMGPQAYASIMDDANNLAEYVKTETVKTPNIGKNVFGKELSDFKAEVVMKRDYNYMQFHFIDVAKQKYDFDMAKFTALQKAGKSTLCMLFNEKDAEKILGEPGHVVEDTLDDKNKTRNVCKFSYEANALEIGEARKGVIYFKVEDYGKDSIAKKIYTDTRTANRDHGIKLLNEIGDEAYFHTDNENFYFILVRKGSTVLCMKVNKITSKTSRNEFMRVAKEITGDM